MKTAEIYNRLHEIINNRELPADVRADLEMLNLDIFQDMRRAPGITGKSAAARWNVPTITWEEWWQRAFDSPAVVKPQITAPALVTLEQFAAIVENAA